VFPRLFPDYFTVRLNFVVCTVAPSVTVTVIG
jgi:hypothetical protein